MTFVVSGSPGLDFFFGTALGSALVFRTYKGFKKAQVFREIFLRNMFWSAVSLAAR